MTTKPPWTVRLTAAAFALAILASGCAPVISKGVLEGANRDVSYGDVVEDPNRYRGETVVFGGSILNVENEEGATRVFVLHQPLNWRLRPTDATGSAGRFVAEFKGFVDPAIYAKGRELTVAGTITGFQPGTIGNMPYLYPVIEVVEGHLWDYGRGGPRVGVGLGVIYGN